jgi:multicomponent Na+:H+ antiporter subunit D
VSGLLVVSPVLVPLFFAGAVMVGYRRLRVQRAFGVAGALVGLVAAIALATLVWREGPQTVHTGAWPAPIAISLVADTFAALMVLLSSIVGAAVAVYATAEVDERRLRMVFFALLLVLLAGVNGAFLTADLFNLYVCFEVMLMASFVLLVLGGDRSQMEGGLKYVTLNLFSSALFLAGVGIVAGAAHSLNLGELSVRMPAIAAERPELVTALAGLFLVAFGLKAAMFPLHFWLPASYHTPPASVSAVFAGLLTKVGVYALIRVFSLLFSGIAAVLDLVLAAAALTMIVGVLGAVAQFHIRRILSFHIVSQIGYIVVGLGLLGAGDAATRRLALTASVFYIAHHILVKTNLFLVGGVIGSLRGSEDLARLGGLKNAAPWLAVLFLVPAASLAGIPPLSGFWAKLGIISAAVDAEAWLVLAAALVAGLLTLLSMVKIWNEAFWKDDPRATSETTGGRPPAAMVAPIVALALLTVAIGLAPQTLFEIADRAAAELLDPDAYLAALQVVRPTP